MDNNEANTDLGIASRKLAFALNSAISSGGDWRRSVDGLQEALYHFGAAIVAELRR